jgi:hypothetical protein
MKGQDHEQAFWIEDGALVGSAAILNPSPRVNTDPMVNRPVPVPSIFRDARGSIHNLQVQDFRINLLHTVQGVMRSGDIHRGASGSL